MSPRRFLLIPAAMLTAGLFFAGSSQAGDEARMQKIRNCADHDVLVCAYNAKDGFGAVQSWSKVLSKGEQGQIKCKGQGQKLCRVAMVKANGKSCLDAAKKGGEAAEFKTNYQIISDGNKHFLQSVEKDDKTCE